MYSGRLLPIRIHSTPLSGTGIHRTARVRVPATHDLGEFGGSYRIHGTVKRAPSPGTPVAKRVRLLSLRDWQAIREVWSDAITGAYAFDWIAANKPYIIVVVDDTGIYAPKAVLPGSADIVPMP